MARNTAAPVAAKAGYRILLDAPAKKPELGYPEIASALADIVMQSDARFAIGIFGGWGAGKTTLMEAVETCLENQPAVPVRFSAWRYEKEEHLILPLLDTIRDALLAWGDERPGHVRASRETARTIGRVMRALVAGTSVRMGVPGAIDVSFDANKALEAGRSMSEARAEARVPRSVYHACFRALRDAFTEFAGEEGKRRIVVFIDDLDRCLPRSALQVLESMKLFFDLDGFVFVVGLDRAVVEQVVDSKYRIDEDGDGGGRRATRVLGEDYIKKIFQVPYTLAPLAVGQLRQFLDSVYEEAELPDAQRNELKNVVERHLPFLVRDGNVNPREVKRYINAYTIATKINVDLQPDAVLTVLMLDFRSDWEDVESALLLNGDVFVDALRRLHAGEAAALDDIGLELQLPDDFVSYTRPGQPGNAFLQVHDIERYFQNVGRSRPTRDIDILQLLPRIGAVRRDVAALGADAARTPSVLGNARSVMSLVKGRLHDSPTPSPVSALILEDVEDFNGVAQLLQGAAADEREPHVNRLEELARRISQRLLVLYRSAGTAPASPASGTSSAA